MPGEFVDDQRLGEHLVRRRIDVAHPSWDDADAGWDDFELVVIRSTWDYARRHDEFCAWADAIGDRLLNPPAVIRWNSDKRYLGELAAGGLAVIETEFVAPGDPPPPIEREVVVKPNVSAGARDTGRFAAERAGDALDLIRRIQSSGRVAMVQPYQASVDELGETACIFFGGEFSHSLRKRAVLHPDEVAPVRDDFIGAAEAMYDSALVGPAEAEADELELADRVLAEVRERFGAELLYARVDMLRDDDGSPLLLELEAVEPNLYFDQVPEGAGRLAEAILARL